ncbi:MAG: glycosyltransferase family 2 protein [Acidimicrobiales bacterium]
MSLLHPVADAVAAASVTMSVLMAAEALYLLVLAIAAFFHQDEPEAGPATTRVLVLVPAHDEADLIGRCLHSLRHQDYPPDLYRVVVIADNCSDATATLARDAGAEVLVRTDRLRPGKGYALRWAMDQFLSRAPLHGDFVPDAFVIVDADSVTQPEFLRHLSASARGCAVAQGDYSVFCDSGSPRVQLRAAAFLLFHRVRFSGRAALGLPCSLVGNGMLLGREVIEANPWNAFTGAEDLEFTLVLRRAGVRPVFARDARVEGPMPATFQGERAQRERWEGGRLHLARRELPALLREAASGHFSNLDAAIDLVVPPLGVLATAIVAGALPVAALLFAGLVPIAALIPSIVASAGLAGFVVLGMAAAGASWEMYRSLIFAPRFLVEKAVGTRRVLRSRPAHTWVRTERPGERVT